MFGLEEFQSIAIARAEKVGLLKHGWKREKKGRRRKEEESLNARKGAQQLVSSIHWTESHVTRTQESLCAQEASLRDREMDDVVQTRCTPPWMPLLTSTDLPNDISLQEFHY